MGVFSLEVGDRRFRTFDVEGTGEGDPIATPASAIGGKPVGLDSTGRSIWKGKVVATSNETGLCSAGVLGREVRILVR